MLARIAGPCLLLPLGVVAQEEAPAQRADGYVVLSAVAEADAYDRAAQRLATARDAPLLRFDPADLESVRDALRGARPRNVALVMRPDQIEFEFQRRFLQLATEIDADPFVDFAFGYLTGRDAEDALALVERGLAREPRPEVGRVAMFAGGSERSIAGPRPFRLRRKLLDGISAICAGGEAYPDGRDRAFLAEHLPALTECDVITFAGHGYPDEVVGGPCYGDLADLRLDGAVVLNVACYTGVTGTWYDYDDRGGLVRTQVPPEESFCLAVLDAGVLGYTAYLCPRPAGPELDTDLAALVADGRSLGEARRRDYDKTVLGFLGFGEDRLALQPVSEMKRVAGMDPVRDLMLEGATGGVLFGDPACVPYRGLEGESPVELAVEAIENGLRVGAKAGVHALFLHCSDPTARWGNTMAMKVHARIPIGDAGIEDVVVDELTVRGKRLPSRVLWAIEEDQGERFLQLKVNFPREEKLFGSLEMSARVLTTHDPARARSRGGEVTRAVVASRDVHSSEIQPSMLTAAAQRAVSREALQAALDSSAELLAGGSDGAGLDRLRAFGSEGFRAVCVLLEVGHSHFRTWQLLDATWHPGDERHLIALASGPQLPAYASWQVLEGLGVADTPEVRGYLLERLRHEEDPGLFMATAAGLAHLGMRESAAMIADRVLEGRPGWSGVEPHLLAALLELGGAPAVEQLERIARGTGGERRGKALRMLESLDAAAAARVRDGGERR